MSLFNIRIAEPILLPGASINFEISANAAGDAKLLEHALKRLDQVVDHINGAHTEGGAVKRQVMDIIADFERRMKTQGLSPEAKLAAANRGEG